MRYSAFALAAPFLLLPMSAAQPQSGEDRVEIEFVVTSVLPNGPTHRDDPVDLRVEFAGVSHAQTGAALFDRLAVRCTGSSQLAGDRGRCVATDRDGDALFFSYRFPDEAGGTSALITGGAGKFAGLSGRLQGASAMIPVNPGLPLFVARLNASWRDARVGLARRN